MTNDVRSHQNLGTAAIGRRVILLVLSVTVILLASSSGAFSTPLQVETSTERQIASLKAKVEKNPKDVRSWTELGVGYTRRAYETGDPTYYPLAARSFEQAEKLTETSPEVFSGQAFLALARHQFRNARELAVKALVINPTSFDAKLALLDANIELGRYDEADVQVEALVTQRAGVASLSRLSYVRQLRGDLLGAEAAMRSAVAASQDGSIDRSVALAYLGEVLLERGKGDAATRSFRQALAINPGSIVASIGLATIYAEDRDWKKANELLETLSERAPTPAVLGLQADIARASGNRAVELAANQLVDATVRLYEVNGAVVDSEMAVLLADRGAGSQRAAVLAAKKAYADRQTIFTADAMAWALFQSGQPKDAVSFAKKAIAAKPSAASVRWHAAAIFAANGDVAAAKAELLAASPNKWFSPTQRLALVSLSKRLGAS